MVHLRQVYDKLANSESAQIMVFQRSHQSMRPLHQFLYQADKSNYGDVQLIYKELVKKSHYSRLLQIMQSEIVGKKYDVDSRSDYQKFKDMHCKASDFEHIVDLTALRQHLEQEHADYESEHVFALAPPDVLSDVEHNQYLTQIGTLETENAWLSDENDNLKQQLAAYQENLIQNQIQIGQLQSELQAQHEGGELSAQITELQEELQKKNIAATAQEQLMESIKTQVLELQEHSALQQQQSAFEMQKLEQEHQAASEITQNLLRNAQDTIEKLTEVMADPIFHAAEEMKSSYEDGLGSQKKYLEAATELNNAIEVEADEEQLTVLSQKTQKAAEELQNACLDYRLKYITVQNVEGYDTPDQFDEANLPNEAQEEED